MGRVRFSRLKQMALSPAHYAAYDEDARPTPAMVVGRAVHSVVLLEREPLTFPGAARRGRAWDDFCAEHGDAADEALTAKDREKVLRMSEAVIRSALAREFLAGTRERTIHWDYVGRACRSTPDAYTDAHVADLKTTACAEPGKFRADALRRWYHAQLAFYAEALVHSKLAAPRDAYIVAVESSAPYPVTVMRLTADALDVGHRACRSWMERLLACESAGEWPGYCQSVVDLAPWPSDDDDMPTLTFGDDDDAAEVIT